MNEQELVAAAEAWMEGDPDPKARAELLRLVRAGHFTELQERFAARLEFGTAGIRGRLGAGPNRMNRALVRKVTAGLAEYLLKNVPDARTRGVVLGRDGRHMSLEFAEDTAGVLAGAGIPVHYFEDVAPTPLCSYATTALGAVGGVVVTASHNPPQDNGYKVYWTNGAQIIPPHDHGISRAIDQTPVAMKIPVLSMEEAREKGLLIPVPPEIGDAYVRAVVALRRHPEVSTDIGVVYTPLHGVGGAWVKRAFAQADFNNLYVVEEQAEPHPDFPTVTFPNPEEDGAMDLALSAARRLGAELVLANDPDADRLAVSVRTGDGLYQSLSGNEIGIAMAFYLLTENPVATNPLVMTTLVSSSLLKKMAGDLGARYQETLTGYKWIANRAIELRDKEGLEFVFGFEEALGYTVSELVRDKDGVGAALVFADLASFCRDRGQSVLDWIEGIYRRYGFHLSGAKSVTLPGKDGVRQIATIMNSLRELAPRTLAEIPVVAIGDVQTGTRTEIVSGEETRLDFPSSNVLFYELEDGSRVLVRPSGTEPKIKYYFEIVEPVGDEDLSASEGRARKRMETLMEGFLRQVSESESPPSRPS